MSEEYLWNRRGGPDPEVVRLESLLGQLQYRGSFSVRRRRKHACWLAVAAAVLIAGVVAIPLMTRGTLTAWQLADGHRLRAGQMIETNASARLSIESEFTGRVDIEPQSRLKLSNSAPDEERFHLERGTIHALIWAPAGRFVVDTPSAKTTDLGCSYTLQVSENGSGLLTVETGWVAFEYGQAESFIPAGAACVTRPGRGPGIPWFSDAPETLKAALEDFDTGRDRNALSRALQSARGRDGLTLWHLLVRTQGQQRGQVYDRLAQQTALPLTVTKAAVLRGDPAAIDGAWNALQLGSTEWWRNWKRKW